MAVRLSTTPDGIPDTGEKAVSFSRKAKMPALLFGRGSDDGDAIDSVAGSQAAT